MIRVGIIGAGYGTHVQAEAIKYNREFSLFGVAAGNYKSAKKAKKATGFKYAFSDWSELVAHRKVEMVIVATPPHSHFEIAREALRNGKHVVVSAPFVLSVDEAQQLAELATQQEKIAVIGHHLNYLPARSYTLNLVKSGKVGRIQSVRRMQYNDARMNSSKLSSWRLSSEEGGGVLWEQAPHDVDFLLRLIGGVNLAFYNGITHYPMRYNSEGEPVPSDADDSGSLSLKFHTGAQASLEWDEVYPGKPLNDFIIHGDEGTLYVKDDSEIFFFNLRGDRERVAIPPSFHISSIPGPAARAPFYMFSNALAATYYQAGDSSPTFDEGVHIQRVLDAASKSVMNEQWTEIGRDAEKSRTVEAGNPGVVHKIFE